MSEYEMFEALYHSTSPVPYDKCTIRQFIPTVEFTTHARRSYICFKCLFAAVFIDRICLTLSHVLHHNMVDRSMITAGVSAAHAHLSYTKMDYCNYY